MRTSIHPWSTVELIIIFLHYQNTLQNQHHPLVYKSCKLYRAVSDYLSHSQSHLLHTQHWASSHFPPAFPALPGQAELTTMTATTHMHIQNWESEKQQTWQLHSTKSTQIYFYISSLCLHLTSLTNECNNITRPGGRGGQSKLLFIAPIWKLYFRMMRETRIHRGSLERAY